MRKVLLLFLVLVMLLALAACGGGTKAEEAPAAAPAAAAEPAAADVTWEDYLSWLADTFGANSPDPEAYRSLIFQAKSWDDIDVTVGPWDKLFSDDAFGASTWDEFVAAGGVGTYNESFMDDAATGSGEPTGEPADNP